MPFFISILLVRSPAAGRVRSAVLNKNLILFKSNKKKKTNIKILTYKLDNSLIKLSIFLSLSKVLFRSAAKILTILIKTVNCKALRPGSGLLSK
jgi:hypothetical protein